MDIEALRLGRYAKPKIASWDVPWALAINVDQVEAALVGAQVEDDLQAVGVDVDQVQVVRVQVEARVGEDQVQALQGVARHERAQDGASAEPRGRGAWCGAMCWGLRGQLKEEGSMGRGSCGRGGRTSDSAVKFRAGFR